MAYGEKYFVTFCDRYGDSFRISILQNNFVGTAIELESRPDPILITRESADMFKFSPIRPSTAEVFLIFGTGNGVDFEELWTADEREFKVEFYKELSLEWVGYMMPNGFQYEFRGGVYYASIVAADGLSTLEDIPFTFAPNVNYGTQDLTYNNGFEFPFILIATEILRKLELDLNLWTAVDVYEKSMTKTGDTRDADPLATSFVNVKTYINDTQRKDIPYWQDANEAMDCKKVMENLCYIFGAILYQNKGVWRIKRRNVDADYGSGTTQRYWRKYNTLAVYLPAYEPVNNEINIPCSTIAKAMIGNDHIMSMDEVYGAFRINYEYTFVREGDSPVNLLNNGNLVWPGVTNYNAPGGWVRWSKPGKWKPRLRKVDTSDINFNPDEFGGIQTAIEFGTVGTGFTTQNLDSNAAIWASLKYASDMPVTKGDILTFTIYNKYRAFSPDDSVRYYPLFKLKLKAEDGKIYYLRNNIDLVGDYYKYKFDWIEDESLIAESFFFMYVHQAENWDVNERHNYKAYNFKLEIESLPATGNLEFHMHGLGANKGRDSDNFPAFPVWEKIKGVLKRTRFIKTVRKDWADQGGDIPRLQITGVFIGKIPNEAELPQGNDYVYENTTGKYSLQVDPITILNGDTQDAQHISNIIVPTNITGEKNFWDTIDNKYGYASLGLITCKSIMNLYFKPFRILEGTIMAQNMDFDTKFTFDALPGIAFVLQRATFNPAKAYVQDAAFIEISNASIPAGGFEGGNTLDANWVATPNRRCQKDAGGLNTTKLEIEEQDINPNSETFGQVRWVESPIDASLVCPLGQPADYYWGTDIAAYSVANFTTFTYEEDPDFPNQVQCPFTNPGGEYIYFLHRTTKGLVENVATELQSQIISDFQYLADTTINGFTYRVLRQNYVTASFEDLVITFTFTV